jgi:hypothetical protein
LFLLSKGWNLSCTNGEKFGELERFADRCTASGQFAVGFIDQTLW